MVEQSAFVLHSRPYRDNQLLVDLLTEQDGKVSALVYVGQSKRSIKKGLLQPFLPLKVSLKNLSALKKISQIESSAKSLVLQQDHLYSAFYINELLIKLLTDGINCQVLFNHYAETLIKLAQKQAIAPVLRQFELALLDELGLSFDFTPVFEQEAIAFSYVTDQGFVAIYQYHESFNSPQANYFDKQHLQQIAEQITTSELQDNGAVERTFKRLMRHVIAQLLGNKPLNSRKLFLSSR